MKYVFRITVLTILLAGQALAQVPDQPHILVTGNSEIRIVPDILHMSLNISEVDLEVKEARNSIEQRSAKLIAALTSIGVASKDINSAELKITPHYNWSNRSQVYVGTEVSRTIDVTLRDLSNYEKLVRSILDAKVARINNTSLTSTKEKELKAKALQGAVKDAKNKAHLLVEDFPEKIGSLHSISASSPRASFGKSQYRVAELAAQKSFEPGEITISESVQVIFYLDK